MRYKITLFVEADSAAEAVTSVMVDSDGEFVTRYERVSVEPALGLDN